nr:MAG TPA: hypothetical protein [Caudoviricetes sp.]
MGLGRLQGDRCGGEKIFRWEKFWGRGLVGLQRKISGG